MKNENNIRLNLSIEDEVVRLEFSATWPKAIFFEDEYDLNVLKQLSEETDVEVYEIILKGLFVELQHLGITVSYEDEMMIKDKIKSFIQTA